MMSFWSLQEQIMQTRSGTKRIHLLESSSAAEAADVMDTNLWGTLPRELALKVYTSLEIKGFYQLREVCKSWNQEACSRRCFTDQIPKPYFVMLEQSTQNKPMWIQKTAHNTGIGIIGYNISAGTWMAGFHTSSVGRLRSVQAFHCFDPIGDVLEPFTVEGILFGKSCFNSSVMGERFSTPKRVFLFDIQVGYSTVNFITFGSETASLRVPEKEGSAIGMMVDTFTKPHGVKLIVGTPNESTLILDAKTKAWKTYPSQMIRNRPRSCPRYTPKSCISCDGKVYIWADMDEIQVYSMAEDQWSTLDPPPRHPLHHDTCRGLGHWQNVVYAVTRTDELFPTVWKLGGSHAWEKFDLMPADLWEHLHSAPLAKIPSKKMRILLVNHCCEWFLMHFVSNFKRVARQKPRRHVLFNLANKRWETMADPHNGIQALSLL